jgi:hypothetical protein
MMVFASLMGAILGAYYATSLNPLNNYFGFVLFFALIGVIVANLIMLVVYEAYRWLKQYYPDNEQQISSPEGTVGNKTVSP